LDSGLVVKIEGSLKLKATAAREIDMDLHKPKQRIDILVTTTAKLAVIGFVSLLGKTLADAELSASTGIDFKGNIDAEWATKTFDLKGSLKLRPCVLSGCIKVPLWFKKIDPPVEVMRGADMYTFK
jgi:hypothetical protein